MVTRLTLCAMLVVPVIGIGLGGRTDGCTIFHAYDGEIALGGNNEDWEDPNTIMWLEPPAEGAYGRAYFGFLNRWPQGGVNDQGLFFDGAATASLPLANSSTTTWRSCASV